MEKSTVLSFIMDQKNYIITPKYLVRYLGLTTTVVLMQLISFYEFYRCTNQLDETGMFYCTIETLENDLGISRKKQESSLKKLKNEGIIFTVLKGLPAKRYFTINQEKLLQIVNNLSNNEVCTKQTMKFVQKGQSYGTKDTTNNIINNNNILKDHNISPSQDFPPKGVQSLNAQGAPVYNTIITSEDNIPPGKPYNFSKQDSGDMILADGDNTRYAGSTVHGQMSTYDGLFVADRQEDTPAPASKLDKYFKKLKDVPIKQEHYPYFVRWIKALLTKKIRQTDVQFVSQGTHLNEYITSANFNANVLEEAFKLLEDTDNGYRNIIKALKNCSVPQKTSYKSEVQKQKEALDMFIRKPGCM